MPLKVAIANVTDQVGILDPRVPFFRRSVIGPNWTRARLGMFFTFVPLTNDDAAVAATETIVNAGALDWWTFGLKDRSYVPPGKVGSQYLGLLWPSPVLHSNAAGTATFTAASYNCASYDGATQISLGNTAVGASYPIWAANCHTYFGVDMAVVNPGLANQYIAMTAYNEVGPAADLSLTNLHARMAASAAIGAAQNVNWFAGGVALPLPDSIWIRSPFNLNRLRISALDIISWFGTSG